MSDARQADKLSGRACRTPENGFSETLHLDDRNENRLIAVEADFCSFAAWIDADASREDVQEVLEDLAAEAEYLGGASR